MLLWALMGVHWRLRDRVSDREYQAICIRMDIDCFCRYPHIAGVVCESRPVDNSHIVTFRRVSCDNVTQIYSTD